MKLILSDGGQFEGQSFEELVNQIWRSSKFDDSQTAEEYMKRFAERIKLYNGAEIRTNSAEFFLRDLIDSGFGSLTVKG